MFETTFQIILVVGVFSITFLVFRVCALQRYILEKEEEIREQYKKTNELVTELERCRHIMACDQMIFSKLKSSLETKLEESCRST